MTNRLFKNFMSRSVCENDYTIYARYKKKKLTEAEKLQKQYTALTLARIMEKENE